MKIITKIIDGKIAIPKSISHFIGKSNYCVIDIETMGLNRKFHQVILIGYLYEVNNQIIIKQLFAEKPDEEPALLKTFLEDIKNFDTYITYNGNSFDIPFLASRMMDLSLSWSHEGSHHMDLLIYIRKYQEYLKLENYKLKTVEKLIGIDRQDTISGKDSVELYKQYVKSKSPQLEEKILLHNYEDIYYLSKLLSVFNHLPLADYYFTSSIQLKDIKSLDFFYNPYNFSIIDNKLKFTGKTEKLEILQEEIHYHPNFSFKWIPSLGIFEFELSLMTGKLSTKKKYYYIDLCDFPLDVDFYRSVLSDTSILHQNYLIIDCQFPASVLAILQLKKQLLQALLLS